MATRPTVAALAAVAVLAACSPDAASEAEAGPDADPFAGTAQDLDEHARAACREWSDTIDADPDVEALRDASARITAIAAPSDNADVVDAAVQLQAGLTDDDPDGFEAGAAALTDACWPTEAATE